MIVDFDCWFYPWMITDEDDWQTLQLKADLYVQKMKRYFLFWRSLPMEE